MAHQIENPFGFSDEKSTPEHWDCQSDFIQAEAFMIAERYVNSLRDDPERRILAIGQMQGFLGALRAASPAETFNHYLEQMKSLDAPGDEAQGFLDHLSPCPVEDSQSTVDPASDLGFEVIRFLSQTAEACSLFALEQGYDASIVKLSVHCSDRAEHIAQYFLESPTRRWPLDSALDDLVWLMEVDNLIDRVRAKVLRSIPSREDLERLSDRVKVKLASSDWTTPIKAADSQGDK